eukprot:TRINITY_DN41134_c0_g1_i1.p1 TRINITY_DN41134_c0_g1~~TRINITY_DN41134_c0_g1_i1.p1  ORF type:complete len:194 (+),score=25.87 TRINITY_DN41134_c0_g1_i1:153-734(+)
MLIGLLGLLTSQASRALSDTLTFAINLAVMTNIVQFAYGTTVTKRSDIASPWRKWGPFLVITAASAASMMDITRQVVLDSSAPVLLKPDGSKGPFNFDACSYSAMALPIKSVGESASCPTGPTDVVQAGAFGKEFSTWLDSSRFVQRACSLANLFALVFTILGFAWLSETITWLRLKWTQIHKDGLAEALLSS